MKNILFCVSFLLSSLTAYDALSDTFKNKVK